MSARGEATLYRLRNPKIPFFKPESRRFFPGKLSKPASFESQPEKTHLVRPGKKFRPQTSYKSGRARALRPKAPQKSDSRPTNKSSTRGFSKRQKRKMLLKLLNKNQSRAIESRLRAQSCGRKAPGEGTDLFSALGELMERRKRRLISTMKITSDQKLILNLPAPRALRFEGRPGPPARQPQGSALVKREPRREKAAGDFLQINFFMQRPRGVKSKAHYRRPSLGRKSNQKKRAREKVEIKQVNITAEFGRDSGARKARSQLAPPKKKTSLRFKAKFHGYLRSSFLVRQRRRNCPRGLRRAQGNAVSEFRKLSRNMVPKELNAISESKTNFNNFLIYPSSLMKEKSKTKSKVRPEPARRPAPTLWRNRESDLIRDPDSKSERRQSDPAHLIRKYFFSNCKGICG